MDGKSTEVSVGAHRISVTVFGRGEPAVVDSSHEAQEQVLRGALPWRVRVLEALTVPILMALPRSMRNGADRRSIVREFRSIKALTAAGRPLGPLHPQERTRPGHHVDPGRAAQRTNGNPAGRNGAA